MTSPRPPASSVLKNVSGQGSMKLVLNIYLLSEQRTLGFGAGIANIANIAY